MAGIITTAGGVRARAKGAMQRAGEWPCKLAKDGGVEGMEMSQVRNGEYCLPFKASPSPSSVTDITGSWDFMPRGGLNLDSVAAALQGTSTSTYLSKSEVGMGEKMSNQTNQRYGGGVFASLRGAHTTWQNHTECDASNTRQKHALSMALCKNRGKNEVDVDCKDAKEAGEQKKSELTGNESLMGLLMRGLHDDASSTFTSMTRQAPSGYTGVRASAFALVSANAVASGRPAPDRHAEAPPRVPLNQPSTTEGVSSMSAAAVSSKPRSSEAGASILTARRPESAVSLRKSLGRNTEW